MESIQEFIKPELLILIPVLYIIGVGINTSKVKDKYIPAMLGIAGIILSTLYVFATSDTNNIKDISMAVFVAITQGVLTAGASVYFNQLYKQHTKKE